MDHTGAGNISHCVVILQKGLSRKNHILIENRPADKTALKPEFLGYRAGKCYRLLPKWLILKLTMNREYWKKACDRA